MATRYPRLGLPLPLELLNTQFAEAGQPRDGLTTSDDLAAWLAANALPAGPADQLERFRTLRGVLRALCLAAAEQHVPSTLAVDALNAVSADAPYFAQLSWRDRLPRATLVDVAGPSALATVARASIELLAGPDRERIGVCQAPGCVLFFLKQRRRRDWCSAACGNRARVARHYGRHRRARTNPSEE